MGNLFGWGDILYHVIMYLYKIKQGKACATDGRKQAVPVLLDRK